MLDAIVPFLKELVLIPLTLLPIINPFQQRAGPDHAAGGDAAVVRRLARQVSVDFFYVIVASMLVGTNVLALFGISLPILRVGGGLLVCATAWRMLNQRGRATTSRRRPLKGPSRCPRRRSCAAASSAHVPADHGPGHDRRLNRARGPDPRELVRLPDRRRHRGAGRGAHRRRPLRPVRQRPGAAQAGWAISARCDDVAHRLHPALRGPADHVGGVGRS